VVAAISAEVAVTLEVVAISAATSNLPSRDEKPTRARVGFSVSTAYHDLMSTDPNCPMCQTVAELERHGRADLVWRFPHSIAIVGPWQYYTGYCMLFSRDHATELSQLGPIRSAHLDEMTTLAQAIEECFRPHKLNYELLGNQVPHLHWHLFPRYASDPERLQPVWLALERAKSDPAEKQRLETGIVPPAEVARRLRDWLKQHNVAGAP
jgi:diadenosine tetraphosphate (Ap4A) HIT family hydrolase